MLPERSERAVVGVPASLGLRQDGAAASGPNVGLRQSDMARLSCPGWLLCWLPLTAGLLSQPRLPVLAGPAPLTAIARRAPVELTRCSAPPKLSTEELDELIDDVTKNTASSPIIRPYDPEGAWLWSQWSGSLLQLTRWKVLGLAFLAGVNCAVVSNALLAD